MRYSNFFKQASFSDRYADEGRNRAVEQLVNDLSPAITSLWMGMRQNEGARGNPEHHQGLRGVYDQLKTGLGGSGVTLHDQHGAEFDPGLHDAIQTTCDSGNCTQRHLVEILVPGISLGSNMLRPAGVRVFH